MNPRTCIVTRTEITPDGLIRFVLDPSGNVVPDLKRKLPGRGVWVSLDRKILEQAVAKNLFARGFKQQARAGSDLIELVSSLLEKESLETLALARKAGQAVTGFMKVDTVVRSGNAAALVHASDASADGKGKLAQSMRVAELDEVPVFDKFSGEQLDGVLGNDNTVHVALLPGGLARSFVRAMNRLNQFEGTGQN